MVSDDDLRADKLDTANVDMPRCTATTRSGKACTFRGRCEHPEHGALCGTHLRCVQSLTECCICLDAVPSTRCKRLQCGHSFHRQCIRKWFTRGSLTCPMCRTVCFEELSSAHPLISERIRHFLRVVPVPPGIPFAAFMLGMLSSAPIQEALGLTPADHQLLTELVYQSFTQDHFFEYLRYLQM